MSNADSSRDAPGVAETDGTPIIFENTREAWLGRLVELFRPYFARVDYPLPQKVYVSVGFPPPRSGRKAIGVCFPSVNSDDGNNHIFIHPKVDDPVKIGATVMHELCHVALDCEGGHGREFKKLATGCGLIGKMTETQAGPMFEQMMEAIIRDQIGPYPHAKLSMTEKKRRQSSRQLLLQCLGCGYKLRGTRQWLRVWVPTCQDPDCPCYGEAFHVNWNTRPEDTHPDFTPDFET
jgi:SprT-like family